MLRSLLIKGLMLGVTIGFLMLMGRPSPPEGERQGPLAELREKAGPRASGLTDSPSLAAPPRQSTLSPRASPRNLEAKLDLNRATADDLQRLPTIGHVLAERIVNHRNTNGLYSQVEQLLEVKGIGRTRLKHVRPFLTVSKQALKKAPADRNHPPSLSLAEHAS